ncbi:DUF1850 domain-containing protein [Pontibacillus litoralis]|uniref:RocC n=1 Tax=Pontibacillus litoralis JSM 072002 TaxID=1385512 RepID=A0A0A5G9A0_9BACI|nr:DUF1850 domain-containing protein [Pontibacillus litoralis]KGX87690.1 hypothetical protein N784_13775 [Pontibacillus litoralis JSM 072002]
MKRVVGICVLCLIIAWYFFVPNQYVLSMEKQGTDQLLAYLPIKAYDTFVIQFVHSVHLSEVEEHYQIKSGAIMPMKLVYEDTAIGMPANATGEDTFHMQDGKYVIEKSEHTEPFSELHLSIGQVRAEHTLKYRDETFVLKRFVGAGTDVTIEVEHYNRWQLRKGVKMK